MEFTVIDTGGIILNETDPLAVQVRFQAEIAMEEFGRYSVRCGDAADGMTSTDQGHCECAARIQKSRDSCRQQGG